MYRNTWVRKQHRRQDRFHWLAAIGAAALFAGMGIAVLIFG